MTIIVDIIIIIIIIIRHGDDYNDKLTYSVVTSALDNDVDGGGGEDVGDADDGRNDSDGDGDAADVEDDSSNVNDECEQLLSDAETQLCGYTRMDWFYCYIFPSDDEDADDGDHDGGQ